MNMKTTKFLAVLAVLAMAFAVFAIIAPTENGDATDYTTVTVLNDSDSPSGTGWAYTASTHTLALTNAKLTDNVFRYEGSSGLIVTVSGTNSITGTPENNKCVLGTNGSTAITIKPADANAASLTITSMNGKAGAIGAGAQNITIGDANAGILTLNVSGLKGIWGTGSAVGNSNITITKSVVTATGSENAIRSMGTITVVDSTITANIDGTGIVNLEGDDNIFGIRSNAISTDSTSKITTQGLRVESTTVTVVGPVFVKGDYKQNPGAVVSSTDATLIGISGLYLDTYTEEPTNGLSIVRASEIGSAPGTIYLDKNAGAYTLLTIKDGDYKEVTIDDASKVADELGKKDVSGVTYKTKDTDTSVSITGTPVVKDEQELVIITTKDSTVSGTITVGTDSGITLALSNVKGTFMITKGSIHIEGDVAGGTLTIAGDTIVDGWVSGNVTIAAATGLTTVPSLDISNLEVMDDGVLNLNGVAVTSTKDIANAGIINLGTGTTFDTQVKIVNAADDDYVAGELSGSNVTLVGSPVPPETTGTTTLGAPLTVNGKLTIPVGTALDVDSQKLTIAEGGVVYVYGSITINGGSVENNGTIVILDKDASIPANISGTGTIDTSAISSDYNISGEYRSAAAFGIYQNVNIVGNTNMVKGSLMIINGTMNVAPGVTLTIEDGAMLIINNSYGKLNNLGMIDVRSTVDADVDTIIDSDVTFAAKIDLLTDIAEDTAKTFDAGFIVYNATVENEGTIDLAWTTKGNVAEQSMVMLSNAIVNNEGLFNVSTLNTMTIAGGSTFNNLEDGTFNMEGVVGTLAINNAGIVKLDGEATSITIHQVADEASVIVNSIKGTLTVDDAGLKYAYPIANGKNSITVISATKALSGLTFDSAVTYSSVYEKYYKNIYINGKVTIDSGVTASIALGSTKYVKVTENLELPKQIELTGKLSVSGTMVLEDGSKYTDADLTVSGLVEAGIAQIGDADDTVNATYFVTGTADKVYHYTTLSKAVDMAVIAEVNKIYVVGENSVTANVTIPSGMTVEQSGPLTIGSASKTSIIMEVEDGAKINSAAAIEVKATLLIDNKSTGITKSADITSDIVVEDSTSIMYTNFVTAMGFEYDEPTTITLSNNVTVESNVTIPAFVTVDTNTKSFTVKGATLTIDGTLFLHNSDYAVTDVPGTVPKIGTVVVNGYIKSTNTTTYDGKAYPAGAYYTMVDKGAFNMITSIANSPNVIDIAEDKSIRIFGADIALGDLAYEGTALAPAYISIEGTVSSGTVDLEYAQLSILADKEISFTVTGADGSIAFAGEKTAAKTVIYEGLDADGDEILAMTAGSLVDGTAGSTHGIAIVGAVVLSDVSLNETTVIGVVAATSNVTFTGDLIVIGVFGVDNASKVTVAGDVFVMGSLIAAEVTETKAAGEMDITKDLYIGGDDEFDTSAAAVVTGDISAANYWVFADVTVEGKIADYLAAIVTKSYYTAFYVEEELFMTIYSTAASEIEIAKYNEQTGKVEYAFIPEELEECVFAAWMYEDDDGQYHPIVTKTSVKVGLYDAVYASIDYNIYSVQIVTDDGVKSVAINGIELVKTGNNVFTLSGAVGLVPLETGTYKVTYTLKNGYQEDKNGVTLYTNTGIVLKDHSFVASGATGYETIYLQLSGTEIIPEPEPVVPEKESEWTITTILLVVLVILIAIMAVIVALRLNRN